MPERPGPERASGASPDPDYGPDPRLNGRGVRLSRTERRRLLLIAAAILGVVLLALLGLAAAFPH